MLRGRRREASDRFVECTAERAPKVIGVGVGTGALSGFFGIGGGFLIVPGLVGATGMPMLSAVGTSLIAVSAFGLTTAISYALSGLVDWWLALMYVAGGVGGGVFGARIARRMAATKGRLTTVFAGIIIVVACYMAVRSASALAKDPERCPTFTSATFSPASSAAAAVPAILAKRAEIVPHAFGSVLEVGCGGGINFPYYDPSRVVTVLGVDPSPELRAIANTARRDARVPVEVLDGIGEALTAADGSFDTFRASGAILHSPTSIA